MSHGWHGFYANLLQELRLGVMLPLGLPSLAQQAG
jgi:hypothetical protein